MRTSCASSRSSTTACARRSTSVRPCLLCARARVLTPVVMEYLGGGEIKWHDGNYHPVLTLSQSRRILRDTVLGLEYRESLPLLLGS